MTWFHSRIVQICTTLVFTDTTYHQAASFQIHIVRVSFQPPEPELPCQTNKLLSSHVISPDCEQFIKGNKKWAQSSISISHQHYQQLTGIYIPQNAQTCILYTFFIKENWNILTTKWSEKMLSVNLHIIRGTCPLDGIITSINHLVIFYKSNHFKSITTTTPFVCCLFYTIHALGLIHLWNKCPLLIFLLM